MTKKTMPNWAEELELRDEVTASDGSVGELQMSLGKVVHQTVDVPYRKVDYWCDITEPTDSMVGVFARVARRLWSPAGQDADALFQFDQGMGGGKSHSLVGMWHMARTPDEFFASHVGGQVIEQAEAGGRDLDPGEVHVAALCADQFSPGKADPLFGPATNLFERFLWSLFPNDRDTFDRFRDRGADKGTVAEALKEVGKPVLVMVDELMDYVAAAAAPDYADQLNSVEHQFLNSLFDACDDVPNVVVLLVMIRSDLDAEGYTAEARSFREFVQSRINRNGTVVRVTESKDFMNIIRRRLFVAPPDDELSGRAADAFLDNVDQTWQEHVFDRLPGGRNLTTVAERVRASYPFHPDLVSLVQDEWSSTVGFQRVRSTVRIFASTLAYWFDQDPGRVPPLIGPGDIALNGKGVLDNVLNSGLLLNNDQAVQGFGVLAGTDVIALDGTSGRAVDIDRHLADNGLTTGIDGYDHPATRMATALFCLSLVNRAQQARGALKPELLSAVWAPGLDYATADEVFAAVTDEETGLGSLEVDDPGNHRNRYWLSIKRTTRSLHRGAKNQVSTDDAAARAWQETKQLAGKHKSAFDRVIPVDDPGHDQLGEVIADIDEQSTRLVVLDPSRWTLLNGKDTQTRQDIDVLLGAGTHTAAHAASCVVAVVNTHQRQYMTEAAKDLLAWEHVIRQQSEGDDEALKQAKADRAAAEKNLQVRITVAFRHYAFLGQPDTAGGPAAVQHRRFEDDSQTSLRGDHVWTALVGAGRATQPGQLGARVLALLLEQFGRPLTPREIVQQFYGNPAFPLVATTEDVTHAWDGLLGVGPHKLGGWALFDGNGDVRHVSGPGQITINRMDVTFQHNLATDDPVDDGTGKAGTDGPDGSETTTMGTSGGGAADTSTSGGGEAAPADTSAPMREYRLTLPNVSLGDRQMQKDVWRILSQLVKFSDPAQRAQHDPQVIDLKATLTMRQADTSTIQAALDALGKGSLDEDEPLA